MKIVLVKFILTGLFTRLLLPIRMDSEATSKLSTWAIQPDGYEVV